MNKGDNRMSIIEVLKIEFMKVLILGFVETIIFFMVGWYLGKIKHYE